MRDLLEDLYAGQKVSASQWRMHRQLHSRSFGGGGVFEDGSGVYFRQRRRKALKEHYARLTENLDAGGSATARLQLLNSSSKAYEDDSSQEEITVYDTLECFCGIKGELIEIRNAGTGSSGAAIWEVVRGGAVWHVGERKSGGEAVTVTALYGTEIEITPAYRFGTLPSDYVGPVGITYDFEAKTWVATQAMC